MREAFFKYRPLSHWLSVLTVQLNLISYNVYNFVTPQWDRPPGCLYLLHAAGTVE